MSEAHHARLLLAIVREDWPLAERLAARRPVEASGFLRLARQCDVHPWLHARLEALGRFDLVGPEVEHELAAARHKCRMDNLLLLARAEQALDRLLAAGVLPIALKGLDLLHRAYDGFDVRTLDDVDLLVRRRDLPATLAALQAAGWGSLPPQRRDHYLRSSHHLPLPGPGPVPVDFEIHWNLVQQERYSLDPERLFERALPLEVAGRRVLRLEDHDLAAHLLLHHFTHYFDRRLKWAIDLRWIAQRPGFDWEVVARRVAEWGARAAVAMSVLHLARMLPDLVPAEAKRHFPVAAWRLAVTLPLRSSHPLDLFRGTRRRKIQLYLAAAMLENPWKLPTWLAHRRRRDRRPELSPLSGSVDESRQRERADDQGQAGGSG